MRISFPVEFRKVQRPHIDENGKYWEEPLIKAGVYGMGFEAYGKTEEEALQNFLNNIPHLDPQIVIE